MTNGQTPSAIAGDTIEQPGYGFPLQIAIPFLLSGPAYTDLPPYWTPRRDWILVTTLDKEAMWASVVNQAATKFAALGFTVSDSQDSTVRTSRAQELMHGLDGWVPFAIRLVQDYSLCDNGIFIRLRRANEKAERVKLKAAVYGTEGPQFEDVVISSAAPGARITRIYAMDSLRCTRTGNLIYPVRYQAVDGTWHLLKWDQVLSTADMVSNRAEHYGVGRCAASRAYPTIMKIAAMEQLVYEYLTGGGAHKLAFIQGLNETTLKGIINAGKADAQAKGLLYYLGTIIGALPGDTPIEIKELLLKQLLPGFVPREERENAYLIYAKAIGLAPGEVQPNPAGLNSGEREQVQAEQARGYGMASLVKWFEQTFSRRVLPETTELKIVNENDMREQEQIAKVRNLRATTRKLQIESGEINPAVARQIAVDAEDLPRELLQSDATAGGQISDDEKQLPQELPNQAALALMQGLPTAAPQPAKPVQPVMKAEKRADVDLDDATIVRAKELYRQVKRGRDRRPAE